LSRCVRSSIDRLKVQVAKAGEVVQITVAPVANLDRETSKIVTFTACSWWIVNALSRGATAGGNRACARPGAWSGARVGHGLVRAKGSFAPLPALWNSPTQDMGDRRRSGRRTATASRIDGEDSLILLDLGREPLVS
jgi:hypothetical protein